MPTTVDKLDQIVISDEDARGGVTGHNVRYVLGLGLTGVIAMLGAIALYLGYDRVEAGLAQALAQSPSEVIRAFAPYAALVIMAAIMAGLLLGLWNMISGRTENATQTGMRVRVVTQFAIISAVLAALYVSA